MAHNSIKELLIAVVEKERERKKEVAKRDQFKKKNQMKER